jgi:serine/threonine protein kinase
MLPKFLKAEKGEEDAVKVEVDSKYVQEHQRRCSELQGCKAEDFDMLSTLGTGSFGRVKLVRHKATQQVYALKILSKSLVLRTKQAEHIIAEKEILNSLMHPFIVNVYATFQDDVSLYFVLEYVIGGEFFTHLRKANRFSNDAARHFCASVVLVFEHLHSQNIIYRDLKPENLLLDRTGQLKICDFGFAKQVDPASWTWTLCGTPEYLAPEIILNKGHGKAVDWWALGILLYEMLVGYPPFYSDDRMVLYQNILGGRIDFPRHVSKHARDLISKLLQADLSRRLGNLRNGARDVRNHPFFRGFDWGALMRKETLSPVQISVSADDDVCQFDEYPEDDDPELFVRINATDQKVFAGF